MPRAAAAGVMFFGELGLDGRLRPVCGVLPAVARAAEKGFGKVMVAEQNAAEAALVPGVRVIAVDSLTGAADWLRGLPGPDGQPAAVEYQGGQDLPSRRPGRDGKLASGGGVQAAGPGSAMAPDLAELLGQSMARRAAEVCAAGGHHLSLLGPPGAGKTMLAERIPTILPGLDRAAAFEVTAVHSVAGTLPAGPAAGRPALPRAASHGDQGGHRRRRQRSHPPRIGLAGAPGCAVPRRGAGVRQGRAGRTASAAGSGRGGGGSFGHHATLASTRSSPSASSPSANSSSRLRSLARSCRP